MRIQVSPKKSSSPKKRQSPSRGKNKVPASQQKQVDELQQRVQELENQIKRKQSFLESLENKSSMYTNNSVLSGEKKRQPRSLSKNSKRKGSNDRKTEKGTGSSGG